MVYPENKAADEHFENLRRQYAEAVQKVRAYCDDVTDSRAFVSQSIAAMEQRRSACDAALMEKNPVKLVENTSALARLANRVLQVAKQECDNSEDPSYIQKLVLATETMQNGKTFISKLCYFLFKSQPCSVSAIPPVVQVAKVIATNIDDPSLTKDWSVNTNGVSV